MNAGQEAVAQQMQHDFTLQFAQTSFAQQLSAVQGLKDLITPLGLEQWVVDAKLLSDLPAIPTWQFQGKWRASGIRVSERVSGHT